MTESFVDLTYRGLSLGRRIKLTQVRPTSGYLEMPAPMPVGTAISIATDDGLVIDARVLSIHEQIGGSERPPGMLVAPALADEAHASWWRARVALPEEAPAPPPEPAPAPASSARPAPVTVRPRSHTVPAPPPVVPDESAGATLTMSAMTDDPSADVHGARTTVMAAVDPALIAEASGANEAHAIVDDGKQTIVMDAVDPAALGLDTSGGDRGAAEPPSSPAPSLPPTTKKRRRRR